MTPLKPHTLAGRTFNPAHRRFLGEVFRFGAVGTVGFLVDATVLTLAMLAGTPRVYPGVVPLAGMTGNFLLSRRYVFRSRYETAASVID